MQKIESLIHSSIKPYRNRQTLSLQPVVMKMFDEKATFSFLNSNFHFWI